MGFSPEGVEVIRSGNKERRIIASYWFFSLNVKVYDTVTTTVKEYHGMDEDSAAEKAASLYSNTLADYRIHSSDSAGASWVICPLAKGTISTASYARQGNSRMFTVTQTTETHTCSNSANWPEY